MEKEFESKYHSLEEGHWWFVARRDMISRLLPDGERQAKILEIGCSGGALIKALRERGFSGITGIDISERAIDVCRQRGLDNVMVMDAAVLDFDDETFDIVIASDILEHMKDDGSALREWKRLLKKGGRMIVFVPAFPFLWSRHDEVNHHFRRYSRSQLKGALLDAGFSVKRVSFWNCILFFPAALVRIAQRVLRWQGRESSDQLQPVNPVVNSLLVLLVKSENRIMEAADLPFGVSLFADATKPSA